MSYRIHHAYCWYNRGSMIVKMYFINNIAFTFDELSDDHICDLDLCKKMDDQITFEPEDLYKNSFYLIEEEAHPCLFSMELENQEDMPDDGYFYGE